MKVIHLDTAKGICLIEKNGENFFVDARKTLVFRSVIEEHLALLDIQKDSYCWKKVLDSALHLPEFIEHKDIRNFINDQCALYSFESKSLPQ
jgi:hypothetical protein